MEIKINEKFKELLSPLSEEELTRLEESLLKNGLENALMTWQGFIIDGHNRWSIIEKHNLAFHTINRDSEFETEDDVLEWIYTNQLGRRNLNANQRTVYIGELYELRKKKIGAPIGSQNAKIKGATIAPLISNQIEDFSEWQIDEPEKDLTYEIEPQFQPKEKTAEAVAKEFNVSPRKVMNAAKVVQAVNVLSQETKQDFLAGKITQKEVIQQAAETLTPEQAKEDLAKKNEIKNGIDAKWRDATYKINMMISSIQNNGGAQALTAKWNEKHKRYWTEELRSLSNRLGEFAVQIEETI